MFKIISPNFSSPNSQTKMVGYYGPKNNIPIFHVNSVSELNRIIGYARHINACSGTVLYRGECKNHSSLPPSGSRSSDGAVSNMTIEKIRRDEKATSFFDLNQIEIRNWDLFCNLVIESALQHYGAKTYCMDFVDNHWCALWFGLYKYENGHYKRREDLDNSLYIIMYAADTIGQSVHGLYIGEDTYTLDLRKALPSTFQRPASQHGWMVRKKQTINCDYVDRVIGVIEVTVEDAIKWLGEGLLLSEENFFPSPKIDQGYSVLLSRQERSGVVPKYNLEPLLPKNTICNYHLYEAFYYSNPSILSMKPLLISKIGPNNIEDLFKKLLEEVWQSKTCSDIELWDKMNPCKGQSAATALLVQLLFGGEICSFEYAKKNHYYNLINDTIIDLTSMELSDFKTGKDISLKYEPKKKASKRTLDKYTNQLNLLKKNFN